MSSRVSMRDFLWEGTKEAHKKVERNSFVKLLSNANYDLPAPVLRKYLQRKFYYMSVLEEELTRNGPIYERNEHLGRVYRWLKRLFRSKALENSIAYLYTLEGQSPSVADNPIPDVVKQYAEHLRSLSRDKPLMLLVHGWVNLMDGLFGGVTIACSISKRLGDGASQFVRYEDIIPPNLTMGEAIKIVRPLTNEEFKAPLDSYSWTEQDYQVALEEGKKAFEFNDAIFSAMDDLTCNRASL